jgi:hypothetical protein
MLFRFYLYLFTGYNLWHFIIHYCIINYYVKWPLKFGFLVRIFTITPHNTYIGLLYY